jgi:hypothetical protein
MKMKVVRLRKNPSSHGIVAYPTTAVTTSATNNLIASSPLASSCFRASKS